MSAARISTERPAKGDLVKGHAVYMFLPGDLPAVRGVIVAASNSGHSVVVEIDRVLAAFGLPRRSEWTWRNSVKAYQQKGERTSPNWGLARITNEAK